MAYSNMCDRSILSEDGKVIFDLRLKFKSIAVRIQEMEQEITERISIEKDKLLIKIKENNSGQNAKAAKFFTAGMTNGGNMFFPENKKRIWLYFLVFQPIHILTDIKQGGFIYEY